MTIRLNYPSGATPLDPDELHGLIPDYITSQRDLNLAEQRNILDAKNWAGKTKDDILAEAFVRKLHKKMYGNIWRWAGQYRQSDKNIGDIHFSQVSSQIFMLLQNAQSWIDLQAYPWPETLARFHHRLVYIHPFPNGNGRYARLHTELLAQKYSQAIPTWGSQRSQGLLDADGETRNNYITALQEADGRRFSGLIAFMFS